MLGSVDHFVILDQTRDMYVENCCARVILQWWVGRTLHNDIMVTHIIVMWWTRVEETETLETIRKWCDCHIGEKESDHNVSHMHGIVMVDRRRGNADTWFEHGSSPDPLICCTFFVK